MIRKFDLHQLLSVVSIGLVGGAIVLPLVISFAILIYSGELSPFATTGIGMVLFGGLLMQLIIALTSSVPGMIGAPQDSPAAILGLAALVARDADLHLALAGASLAVVGREEQVVDPAVAVAGTLGPDSGRGGSGAGAVRTVVAVSLGVGRLVLEDGRHGHAHRISVGIAEALDGDVHGRRAGDRAPGRGGGERLLRRHRETDRSAAADAGAGEGGGGDDRGGFLTAEIGGIGFYLQFP